MSSPSERLRPNQVAALLRAAASTIGAEARAVGDDGLRWRPAPDAWCVNEVVGHIIEAEERGFAGRIREIIAQPARDLGGWDPPQVARDRRDCDRDGLELVREFETLREESARLVEGLTPEQLDLSGEHVDVGTLRVRDLLHEFVHHDRNHIAQIFANVQAYVWPHMGNAQRFSEID